LWDILPCCRQHPVDFLHNLVGEGGDELLQLFVLHIDTIASPLLACFTMNKMQGGILGGEGGDEVKDILLLDVAPLSLGIETGERLQMHCMYYVSAASPSDCLWKPDPPGSSAVVHCNPIGLWALIS
jgi:hypothetical protein